MATYDNTYSRFIAWLKVLLPVMALILLSTMFLISRSIDPTQALIYAKVDVEDMARTQRITGPRFQGVTDDGAAVSFQAESAQPDLENPAIYTATKLEAKISTPDGGIMDIFAAEGLVDGDKSILEMTGGVSLRTSTNYAIETDGLRAALDVAWAESTGRVIAEGPVGKITAGRVVLTNLDKETGTYLLVFKDGVKMVYNPKIVVEQ